MGAMARPLPLPGRRVETGRYMRATTVAILLLLGLAGASEAHELWVEEASGESVLRYGHGPESAEGPERLAYGVGQVEGLWCREPGGGFVERPLPERVPVRLPIAACAGIRVDLSTGHWVRTPRGVRAASDAEGGVMDAWYVRGSLTRLRGQGEVGAATGVGLELVPLEGKRMVGRKWPLRVVLNGEPLAGIEVRHDGRLVGTTDENGRINVRLRSAGRHRFEASHSVPFPGPEAHRTLHHAILSLPAEAE